MTSAWDALCGRCRHARRWHHPLTLAYPERDARASTALPCWGVHEDGCVDARCEDFVSPEPSEEPSPTL